MSRTKTQSISIASPPDKVFAFVADPEKLPAWAIGFCKEIREEDGRWIVTTPSGEQIPMRSVANPKLGILDGTWELGPSVEGRSFTRVVPNGDGVDLRLHDGAGRRDAGRGLRCAGRGARTRADCADGAPRDCLPSLK